MHVLALILAAYLAGAGPALGTAGGLDYAPPPSAQGDWRSLVPTERPPNARERERMREVAAVDWDRLQSAWDYNAMFPGNTGLLVVRRGWIVGEWYRGVGSESSFNIYSSSKSYLSVAFGLLLAEEAARKSQDRLTLDTHVYTPAWLPEGLPLSDPRKKSITLRQLLTMTSGIPSHNDTGALPERAGPFEFALGLNPAWKTAQLASEPGTTFSYSNASVSHLVLIHRRASGRDLRDYLKARLFDPIGMTHYDWVEEGGDSHIGPHRQGYSGLLTTPRDHARFLYLALLRGRWGGVQVVPADYYGWALAPTLNPETGALWYLAFVPGTPPDTFQTRGAKTNDGWVIPSLDLIVVRFCDGDRPPEGFNTELLRRVQAAILDRRPSDGESK